AGTSEHGSMRQHACAPCVPLFALLAHGLVLKVLDGGKLLLELFHQVIAFTAQVGIGIGQCGVHSGLLLA
ncbi:hypothetical protein H696_06360, partial [Fonticula alba]